MTNRSLQAPARNALLRILEEPQLVAAVHDIPAERFADLVAHVGLEDASELLALATREQVEEVLDRELWRSVRAGEDERFDASRFGAWLEVLLEAGDRHAAQRLSELPEELVLLGFSTHVLVVDIDALGVEMSDRHDDEAELLEKALEGCLYQEFEEYRVIARRTEAWDAVIGALVALDREHHDLLRRILERCAAASSEYIEDNGGLYDVLTSEEMLEVDAAAEREDRRAAAGYVAPSAAKSFLALAEKVPLSELVAARDRDPVARAYFRELDRHATKPRRPVEQRASTPEPALQRLERLLVAAGVGETGQGLALRPAPHTLSSFSRALGALHAEAPGVHAERLEELAFVANVLIAYERTDRRLAPMRAIELATAHCERGLAHLLNGSSSLEDAVRVLRDTAVDKLFRIGWHLAKGERAARVRAPRA